MKKLDICKICNRPMELYGSQKYPGPKKLMIKKVKGRTIKLYQIQGPLTHPKVKIWCYGRCLGITADIDILISVLSESASKEKTKWANKYLKSIEVSFYELIDGLVNKHSS